MMSGLWDKQRMEELKNCLEDRNCEWDPEFSYVKRQAKNFWVKPEECTCS